MSVRPGIMYLFVPSIRRVPDGIEMLLVGPMATIRPSRTRTVVDGIVASDVMGITVTFVMANVPLDNAPREGPGGARR